MCLNPFCEIGCCKGISGVLCPVEGGAQENKKKTVPTVPGTNTRTAVKLGGDHTSFGTDRWGKQESDRASELRLSVQERRTTGDVRCQDKLLLFLWLFVCFSSDLWRTLERLFVCFLTCHFVMADNALISVKNKMDCQCKTRRWGLVLIRCDMMWMWMYSVGCIALHQDKLILPQLSTCIVRST